MNDTISRFSLSQRAAKALFNYQAFSSGNTTVTLLHGTAELRLHGNVIATLDPYEGLMITDAGWNTNVTRVRLNALPGVNLVGGRLATDLLIVPEWDGEWIQIPYWGKDVDKLNEVA